MVRQAKWISSTALGLMLAWQIAPAQAQRFSFESEPAPTPTAPVDDAQEQESQDADEKMDSETETGDVSDANNSETSESDGASDESSQESADESSEGESKEQSDSPAQESDGEAQPEDQTEVIKERYPNGKVKVEREVTQDATGNYLNHGPWKMWDDRGNLVAQGDYSYGNRTGTWIRWYRSVTEAPLLRIAPYKDFAGPYISQATFENGQLNGYWTIYDGKTRKISQWRFVDGRRHGLSTWWHGNGRKMREIEFRDGDIDGQLIEWGPEGAVLLKETYQAGRKLAQKTSTYNDGKKKSEGMYLFAKDVEKTPDDWWSCKLVVTTKTGKDEKHGASTSWHPSGQRQLEGTYEHDLNVGLFTWWHGNGQKALEGRYETGKQDGAWTWWYPTGQKSIQGEYAKGNPTGRWTWWKEDGKVAQSADLSHSEGVVIQEMPGDKPNVLPQVKRPVARPPVRR